MTEHPRRGPARNGRPGLESGARMAMQRMPDLNLWRRVWQRLALALYRRRGNVLAATGLVLVGGGFLVMQAVFEVPAAAVGVVPIAVNVQELQPQGNALPLVLTEKS